MKFHGIQTQQIVELFSLLCAVRQQMASADRKIQKNNPHFSSYADGVQIPEGVRHITANYMNAKKAATENVTEIIV